MLSKRQLLVFRSIIYLYLFLIILFWLTDTSRVGPVNTTAIVMLCITLLVYFLDVKILDITYGSLYILIYSYLLLAVTSDLYDYILESAPYEEPLTYFAFGYLYFGTALIFSVALTIIRDVKKIAM